MPTREFVSSPGASSRVRQADSDASSPARPSDIRAAMEAGHVVVGMDTKQVWIVLGEPVRKTRFAQTATDVWIYRGGRRVANELLFQVLFPIGAHGAPPF